MTTAGSQGGPMAQRRWTPAVLGQLLLVLAVLVAGVVGAAVLRGRDSSREDLLQVVSSAGSSAAAEKTFRSTYLLEVGGAGISITSAGELFVDTAQKVQYGHVQAPLLGTMELRQLGGHVYLRVPSARPLPGGKHWIGVAAVSGAAAVGGQDPLEGLRLLGGARDVRTVGHESVNGVPTTHYAVTVDPARLADLAAKSPNAQSLPPGALAQVKDVTTDLWLDDQRLPRRLRVSAAVQQIKVRISMEYQDYGKPVQVAAPPAADVLEIGNGRPLAQVLQDLVRR